MRKDEYKRFEMLSIDRKPFEEANIYMEDIRNTSDAARASAERDPKRTTSR